jgi:hypothetical protein
MEASVSSVSKLPEATLGQPALEKLSQNANIDDPFSSSRTSPPLVQTDSASSDFDSPMQSQVASPRPVVGQTPKLLKSTFKRKPVPIGTPLRQQSTNVADDDWGPDSPTPKNNGGLSRRVIHGSLLPEMEPSFSKEIESSLMDQTRTLTIKLSELEKANAQLKNELLQVKNKYRSVKKQNDLVSSKEGIYFLILFWILTTHSLMFTHVAQMNETLWNLEVTNQSLTEKVTELEACTNKSRSTIVSLEKSKASYQQKLDSLKDAEMNLIHENESLKLKMDQERLRFKAELEEKRKELEYITSQSEKSTIVAVKNNEKTLRVEEVECNITTVSMPSTPNRSSVTSNPFNESLTTSLKQSQDEIERLQRDLRRAQMELGDMYKKNAQYSQLIDKLQDQARKPVTCDRGIQSIKLDSYSMDLSGASQLTLTNFEREDPWTLNVHKSVQAPSILASSQPVFEIFVTKKEPALNVLKTDFGHGVPEDLEFTTEMVYKDSKSEAGSHSFSQYYRCAESEPSEVPFRWRTQTLDHGTSQVESLTYTMIGTWVRDS